MEVSYKATARFLDCCKEHNIRHEMILKEMEDTYESTSHYLSNILEDISQKYPGLKKGLFVSNDTHANVLVNLLVRKYGNLPDDILLVGFDNSPISREAVIPISTVGQQIDKIAFEAVSLLVDQMNERKKRRPTPLTAPVHKVIPPILFRRETTEKEENM